MTDRLRLAFVGDIMPGDSFFNAGNGLRKPLRKGLDPFVDVEPVLRTHDIVFGNLECVLSTDGERPWNVASTVMRGDPFVAGRLKRAGFTVLNVANNHILQHGEKCFDQTLKALDEQGLVAVGLGCRGLSRPVQVHCRGTRIGFVGYSCRPERFFEGPLRYAFGTEEEIVKDIASLRDTYDLLIVSLHWGEEFVNEPDKRQAGLAHRLVDAGAGLVIGHHSHTYQGIEAYRKGLIAYSLGNFLFDSLSELTRTGLILSVAWDPQNGKIAYDAIPTAIDRRFRITLLSGKERSVMLESLGRLNAGLDNGGYCTGSSTANLGLESVRAAERRHFLRYVTRHPWYGLQEIAGFVKRRLARRKGSVHRDTQDYC